MSCVRTLALVLAMFVASSARAEKAPAFRETLLEGCIATVRAPEFVEVGQAIPCEVRFSAAGELAATFDPRSLVTPKRPETLGVFDVLSISAPRTEAGANGVTFTILDVVLSTLESGTQTPEPLTVSYLAGGTVRESGVQFPTFAIASLLTETTDPSQYRDIQGAIDIPAPFSWIRASVAAVALIAVAALAYWLFRIWKQRQTRALEPDRWALAALGRLEREQYPTRSEFARYYDELTAIARRYTALRFAIPAEQQTTRELLKSAAAHDAFPQHERERMDRILRLADLVKFASATPDLQSCTNDLSEVRAFIAATRPTTDARDGGRT